MSNLITDIDQAVADFMRSIFIDPPTNVVNAVAQYPLIPLSVTIVMTVVSILIGIVYTIRTRSPLYWLFALSGATLMSLLVEPLGDWFVAVWYPTNHVAAATVFDRPMPLLAVFFYAAGIPLVAVFAYEIVKLGLPSKYLVWLIVGVTVLEVPGEMLASHFQWMIYYGNHAVIGGVPIYCIVQNGGMFAVVAWAMALAMPHVRGWRWLLVPGIAAGALGFLAIFGTFPSYIAIAMNAGPVTSWLAGILSTILNTAIVLACIYSPTIRRYQKAAQSQSINGLDLAPTQTSLSAT